MINRILRPDTIYRKLYYTKRSNFFRVFFYFIVVDTTIVFSFLLPSSSNNYLPPVNKYLPNERRIQNLLKHLWWYFLRKIMVFSRYFQKKAPSWMFGRVLNTPLPTSKRGVWKRVLQENKVRQMSPYNKHFLPPYIRIHPCAYQGMRNVLFSENFTCFVFLEHVLSFAFSLYYLFIFTLFTVDLKLLIYTKKIFV